jgi:hypothetical protein
MNDMKRQIFLKTSLAAVPVAGRLAWLDQPEQCARLTVAFLKGAS